MSEDLFGSLLLAAKDRPSFTELERLTKEAAKKVQAQKQLSPIMACVQCSQVARMLLTEEERTQLDRLARKADANYEELMNHIDPDTADRLNRAILRHL